MVIRLTFLLLLLSSFSSAGLTTLTATIDKNPVMVNESLILTIEADDSIAASALNTDALLRNFIVGNTSSSNQTQIINGDMSRSTRWTVLLIARIPGRYTIPPFTIDQVSSAALDVQVIPAVQQSGNKQRDVLVETAVAEDSLSPGNAVFLQSTFQFITKLYLAVDIQRGSLTEPVMDNANIRQLGKDEELSEIKNGKRYRVIKRIYAITPQRSGSYTIKSPVFSGELVTNKRRSFFSGFNRSKPVSLTGQDIEINVKPIPDEYYGQWLPSELVAIHEEWQSDGSAFTVGEPITRTITLTAVGVSEEQLPEITAQYPPNIKTYPDQSHLNSVTRNNRLISQRKDSVAIVPGIAGKLTLPEVKIPWFNTKTQHMEFAVLAEKTIEVHASTIPGLAPAAAPAITALPPQVQTQTPALVKEVAVNSILTWSFLAAWLLTLLSWLIHIRYLKRHQNITKPAPTTATKSGRTQYNTLTAACKANDPVAASAALLQWGKARWPQHAFTSAQEIAIFLENEPLIAAIKTLQQQLYAGNAEQRSWQGQVLLESLKQNSEAKPAAKNPQLNPLHPA